MYDEVFGTDWTNVSVEEAIRRLFALGVATTLGEPDRDEYERLLGVASSAYDRSVLELSFEEGRQRAARNRRDFESDRAAWTALVDEVRPPGDGEGADHWSARDGPTAIPTALARIGVLELENDDLERVRFPDLLRRD